MAKKRKKTKRNYNTKPASDRIFYRRPSIMLAEFMCSGAGLTIVPLAFFAAAIFLSHVCFIHAFA